MVDTPPPRSRRRIRIVLALSLALNLLVVGVIAGAAWRHGGPGGGPRGPLPGIQAYATPYVLALPRSERRALLRDLRRQTPRLGRRERRAAYAEMLAALRADPFDAAALEVQLQEQRDTLASVQATAQDRWLEIVGAMDDAGRAAYADRLEEVLQRGPRKRRRAR